MGLSITAKENFWYSACVQNNISRLRGFPILPTFAAGFLVDYIQKNGNTFLGASVYAQQVLNLIAALATVGIMLFLQFGIINKEKK